MSSDLDWPDGFDRTPDDDREPYPHGFEVTRSEALDSIFDQLRKVDARNVQLDTAAEHQIKNPNRPYADASADDPGVVVRFERDGQQYAVPCDRWGSIRDNARAIALYLDAKRALDRYGVETVEDEFSTQALPSGDDDVGAAAADPPPQDVLGVQPDADRGVIQGAARRLKARYHPDSGDEPNTQKFKQVVRAEDALLDD